MSNSYSIKNVKDMVGGLTAIFDVVRIVDPQNRNTIYFDADDNISHKEYACYKIWNKHDPCENCISLKSLNLQCRMTKYEFVDDDVYHVVSKYIEMLDKVGDMHGVVIEIVSKITDEIVFDTFGKGEFINRLIEAEKKVYTDSLTKVYNRRYYDERIFFRQLKHGSTDRVFYILADLKRFKTINDTYGHDVGDWVLTMVAQTMLGCVRKYDSVIRLGGDEILIILHNCSEEAANRVICDIKKRLQDTTVYDKVNGKFAQGNFGVAYTDNFETTEECIASLMKQADVSMYQDKNTMNDMIV